MLELAHEEPAGDGVHARKAVVSDRDDQVAGVVECPVLRERPALDPDRLQELAVRGPPHADEAVVREREDEPVAVRAEGRAPYRTAGVELMKESTTRAPKPRRPIARGR
jgi:hypothetical protein